MSIEESATVVARFRAVRLRIADLYDLERELNSDELTWRMSSQEQVGTWSWKMVHIESGNIDELVDVAPRGRIYYLKLNADSSDRAYSVELDGPGSRFIKLAYAGAGKEVPEAFWNASAVLKKAEKRGEKWHYAGSAVGPAIALAIPLIMFDELSKLGLFYDEPGEPENVVGAAFLSVFVFLVLSLIATVFRSWSVASSVTLRPKTGTASWLKRAVNGAKFGVQWIGSMHRSDAATKLAMLYATVTAALCAIGAFIVALMSWLFPMK